MLEPVSTVFACLHIPVQVEAQQHGVKSNNRGVICGGCKAQPPSPAVIGTSRQRARGLIWSARQLIGIEPAASFFPADHEGRGGDGASFPLCGVVALALGMA